MSNSDYGIHHDGEYQLTKDLRDIAAMESEAAVTARVRREGRDMFFQWHLLRQHCRILGAHLSRAVAAPVLNLVTRRAR